jgi:hypothetical protein
MIENKLSELTLSVKEYLEIRYRVLQLEAAEKLSESGASLATLLLIGLVVLISILFLSLGAGFYFSVIFESYITGFLIVGGFYFLTALLFLIFRKRIVFNPVKEKIIRQLLIEKTTEKL